MFAWFSFLRSAPKAAPSAPLHLETFEDRLTPTVSFNASTGVLLVQATASSTYEYVNITPAGAKSDGSTGVTVTSSLNNYQGQTFGDSTHPVTNILLDLANGQDTDTVQIAALTATNIAVGAGNGGNNIQIGDALSTTVYAGTGSNNIQIGNATAGNAALGYDESVVIGYAYRTNTTAGTISFGTLLNNNQSNYVRTGDTAGTAALVDILGTSSGYGANNVNVGNGNDFVYVSGNGSNYINAGTGDNTIEAFGNGSNNVNAHGTGEIDVSGTGYNYVNAGSNAGDAVLLVTGSGYVAAATGASVDVNQTTVTTTGADGSVYVQFSGPAPSNPNLGTSPPGVFA